MYKNSLGGPEAAGGTWKSGGQGRPPLQPVLENRVQVEKPPRCPLCAVGVDAYIDPPSKTETPPRGGGWTLLYWVSFSRCRGGRPCPPAGIARFYGNPMRNRNILEGRCGHRPLQKTSQDFTILEGGQSRPPLQMRVKYRVGQAGNRRVSRFAP